MSDEIFSMDLKAPKVTITTGENTLIDEATLEENRKQTLGNLQKAITLQRVQAEKKVIIFMSGLPARGKSFLSKKLTRYLRWMGYQCQIFNAGNLRRQRSGESEEQDASFFAADNQEAKKLREKLAADVLEAALSWLNHEGGQVAIHDATNSTVARRRAMYARAKEAGDVQVIFVESVCNDPKIIEQNMLLKLKGPDYIGKDPKTALADFAERIKNYEKAYETITDEEADYAYIKVIDAGRKVVARNIRSYLPSAICFFLMNIPLAKPPIWLPRHGQSQYNTHGKIGGDSGLSALGRKYAKGFSAFIKQQMTSGKDGGPGSPTLTSPISAPTEQAPGISGPTTSISSTSFVLGSSPMVRPSFLASGPPRKPMAPSNLSSFRCGGEEEEEEEQSGDDMKKSPMVKPRFRSERRPSELPVLAFTPDQLPKKAKEIVVWTSTLRRATETCSYLPPEWMFNQTTMLNEIYTGRCEGMTYNQIMKQLPLEFLSRAKDKLHYRYPGSGESYIDIVERIRPLIIEIERVNAPVVVVGHLATLRALYGYFMNVPLEDIPFLNFPLHKAVCLTELPDGMQERVFQWVGSEDSNTCSWEYLPNYSVKAEFDTKKKLHSVVELGHEYGGFITEDEFAEFREKYREALFSDADEEEWKEKLRHERALQAQARVNACAVEKAKEKNPPAGPSSEAKHLQWTKKPQQGASSSGEEVKEVCGWIGCGAGFGTHAEYVAHIIAEHCSTGTGRIAPQHTS
eukprot:comp15963_c0_seq1/m.13371 comp15963_c0_seq1/g.13371  ORF comp15963_c0_seq1/g.13371 comp15963_c0_seq1/m.13371 type:complete len:743 (-) comp15963_c0_seq1:57-2285(-)